MKKRIKADQKQPARVLARILAEDLESVVGGPAKSLSCGQGCDNIVNDTGAKLWEDGIAP